jgi:thiol-disulfide isomerase/thioredoxin
VSAQRRPEPPNRKPPTAWIIGGVVALIVVIAAIVAITSSGDDEETAPAADAPGAAQTTTGDGGDTDGGDTDTDISLGTGSAPSSDAGGAPVAAAAETGVVTVTGAALPPRAENSDPALGMKAPTLSGQSFDGSSQTIAPGKPTLVVFVAHWCPHCRREVPRIVEWTASGDIPAGLDVVAVATGTSEGRDNYPPSEWLAEAGWPHPVLLDDEESTAGIAMGIDAYPYFLLLDGDGTVLLRDSGEIDTGELTTMIETALAG